MMVFELEESLGIWDLVHLREGNGVIDQWPEIHQAIDRMVPIDAVHEKECDSRSCMIFNPI